MIERRPCSDVLRLGWQGLDVGHLQCGRPGLPHTLGGVELFREGQGRAV